MTSIYHFSDYHYTIEELFGDDNIHFLIWVHKGELRAELYLSFYMLLDYFKSEEPNIARYCDDIRNQMGGYGPKHKAVMYQMMEEGFDFESYVRKYWLQAARQDHIERDIEHQNRAPLPPKEQQDLVQKLEGLNQAIPTNILRSDDFLNNLEKHIISYLIDTYPEIMDCEVEDIEKFRSIMVKMMLGSGMDMLNHINRLRDRR